MTVRVPIGNTAVRIQSPNGGLLSVGMEHEAFMAAIRPLLDATGAHVVPAADAGPDDLELSLDDVSVHVRVPHLDGALGRLVGIVEQELGGPLADLAREDKQRAVARLHALGAFNLRKSVEDVATELGVSRFTVYNYLDRIDAET